MSACICLTRWPRLYVAIEGVRYEVEPAVADSPLFRAWCAEYNYPFRLVTVQSRAA
jgi:hypothetical protein